MLFQNQKYICENCGKGAQYAHRVSFAKNRSKHIRLPNLHTINVQVIAKTSSTPAVNERMRLCTDCIKMAPRPHKIAMADKARLAEVVAKAPAKARVQRESSSK